MQISNDIQSVPWRFTSGEATTINELLNTPLLVAYFQSLKAMALEANILEPNEKEITAEINNAYVAGQAYIVESLLATTVAVPLIPVPHTGE